jgi:hypothetical protein
MTVAYLSLDYPLITLARFQLQSTLALICTLAITLAVRRLKKGTFEPNGPYLSSVDRPFSRTPPFWVIAAIKALILEIRC